MCRWRTHLEKITTKLNSSLTATVDNIVLYESKTTWLLLVLSFAIPLVIITNSHLHHFYVDGAYIFDSGLFVHVYVGITDQDVFEISISSEIYMGNSMV